MKIRLSTLNTPSFVELGEDNALTPAWREIDTDSFDARAKDVFEQQVGRIVQVHPDDESKVQSYNGLELFEGKFRYPGGKDEGQPRIGARHQEEARATEETRTATPTRRTAAAPAVGAGPKGPDAATRIEETHADASTTPKKGR